MNSHSARCKRTFDILLAIVLMGLAAVPMLIIALLIKLTSPGPIIYWSARVGKGNQLFRMPKYRTMRVDTPPLATHLMKNPGEYVTPVGKILRKTSLDELPQVYSVLNGVMSFVGPRPALFNQYDLIELRSRKGIHLILPGVTGWAQINGRDELPIPVKVDYDASYLQNRSMATDLMILVKTFGNVIRRRDVNH